ncbi:MAG TPA: MATE family efflux transporter [Alphaproteobacteria bacterium]|nr:MATE family efflux transporter [Alphaproteobacteria bacterium]
MTSAQPISHGRVWRIAGPIILSNLTVPLLGAVDTAVVGHLPKAWYLGAVAVGAMIFNFLYWAFGFLRMGTTGLTAQAYGAGDGGEVRANLARALVSAWAIGLAMVALQSPIGFLAFRLLEASPDVEAAGHVYFAIRIWSAPAALGGFALLGWFIGIQNTRVALAVQLFMNGLNISLDLLFVLVLGWGVAGVAAATVIAEYAGLLLGLWLAAVNLRRIGGRFARAAVLQADRLRRLFAVNRDIFLRSLCLIFASACFTAQGAKQGDVVLAANAVLQNFVQFLAFGLDGFAFAAEALIGGAIGARDRGLLRQAVRMTSLWAGLCGLGYLAVYAAAYGLIIGLLTGVPEVQAAARAYLPWVLVAPLIAVWSYQLDGIFIGATRTADMRNGMAISLAAFLAADWLLQPLWGNHGLWFAMALMWLVRALTLAVRYPALERAVVPAPKSPVQ